MAVTDPTKIRNDGSKHSILTSLVAALRNLYTYTSGTDTVDIQAANLTVNGVAVTATDAQAIAKAWINLNGDGTIAIRDSFNVSSVTDNGNGDYTITWDTDFANANYAIVGMAKYVAFGGDHRIADVGQDRNTAIVVGSSRINTGDLAGSAQTLFDAEHLWLVAFGDQ